jgi:type VI secretion system protein ImpL
MKFLTFLLDIRVLGLLGLGALAAFLFLGATAVDVALVWAAVALGLALLIWLLVWAVRKALARRASKRLEQAIEVNAEQAQKAAPPKERAEIQVLRDRLRSAVKTIRTSKLGESGGSAALYELPWYMIIGNPAAGKSTAIVKSGLKFPFADGTGNAVQGIGGTRNCDWFFTSEGILLDTAGRYSVHKEDRGEWLGFLDLLKKHRSKAPINGILIAASVAEVAQSNPQDAIQLATNLRQRVQELTEKLEVFAPVYLVFTKVDLVSGFVEFFEDRDRDERDKVWGATLAYEPAAKADAVDLFDRHFEELRDGLKELALARMTLQRGQALPPGVLTFPLEFAALKPALRSFVATLFEENPYQFRPVFRGFYFTSAVQEGSVSSSASEQVALQFALKLPAEHVAAQVRADHGFFLRELFSRVVFADRNLVRQHTSRGKMQARAATFAVAVAVLAVAVGLWSWSYVGNRQLMANVQADLDKAVKLQADRVDLASRLEALEVLQDRIEQLSAWQEARPFSVGLGLYQGETIERRLRDEYFKGVQQVMVAPVAQAIEGYLGEVAQNAALLQPMTRPPGSGAAPLATAAPASSPAAAGPLSRYVEASPSNVEDAYNALKTYLMLAEKPRMESGHLTDQITRFWRRWLEDNRGTMPREQMIRSAERMIAFSLANLQDPAFPVINSNLGLVDQTRENLRRVVRGMPARERVYAEVKARASTRFAPMTVARIVGEQGKASLAGSYAVAGTFTREAWNEYVEEAFKDVSTNELQTADWVLRVSTRDDLSLEGSPDQIRKALTDLYKTEYVAEWQRFMQGITVAEFADFQDAVRHMDRLGDPENSPIRNLLQTLFDQTSWDNPSLLNERMAKTQRGVMDWIKQTILRQSPSQVELKVDVTGKQAEVAMGPIGREFAALSRITMARDSNPALIKGYLDALGKLRTRFNTIKNQGDPGPAARQLMSATLDNSGSELADALRFVDEQMLVGMTPTARATLRPLLVRPLIQAYAVMVGPGETELNRLWAAQVVDPYQRLLAAKYPFDVNAREEAAPRDINKVFGPEGAIAKFAGESLGPLVVRRGESVTPRTWADIGVRLRPEFAAGFGQWVAILDSASGGASAQSGAGASAGPAPDFTFQILPQGAPGLVEYSIDIHGQTHVDHDGLALHKRQPERAHHRRHARRAHAGDVQRGGQLQPQQHVQERAAKRSWAE